MKTFSEWVSLNEGSSGYEYGIRFKPKKYFSCHPPRSSLSGRKILLQHNLLNIHRISLWINDSHEIQTIATPSSNVNIKLLLVYCILKHLLPFRILRFFKP